MPEAPQGGQPTFNFKAAITLMVQRNASDLLLKVGRPATIRVNGELLTLETAPLKPEELKSLAEQIMTPRQVKEFAEQGGGLRDRRAGRGPVPHQRLPAARHRGVRLPLDPVRSEDDPGPEPPPGARGDRDQAARAGGRDRGDGVGQIDCA